MSTGAVTELLRASCRGDRHAREAFAALVYDELKQMAQGMMRGEQAHSVQATMLVSDAFMRLVDHAHVEWDDRSHFFALASRAMRQILVDRARARGASKRGSTATHMMYDETLTIGVDSDADVLAVEDALEGLARRDPRQADMVTMRFYGGMSMEAVAGALGVSKRTADREWVLIKAWLRRELADGA